MKKCYYLWERGTINGGAIYLIYYIYEFIPYAEVPPTEAEK